MTVRGILPLGHPVLREEARPVDPSDVQPLVDDLIDTMRAANGAGLAANQIGVPAQVCVIEVRAGNPRYPYKPEIPLTVLINPVLEAVTTETFANFEGCLSVPDLRGVVDRFVEVRVQATGRDGEAIDTIVRGLSAGTFQHETDHLHGTLFIDHVTDTRTLCTWSEFHERYEAAFVDRVCQLVDRFGS